MLALPSLPAETATSKAADSAAQRVDSAARSAELNAAEAKSQANGYASASYAGPDDERDADISLAPLRAEDAKAPQAQSAIDRMAQEAQHKLKDGEAAAKNALLDGQKLANDAAREMEKK